jgi:hypothetical protein
MKQICRSFSGHRQSRRSAVIVLRHVRIVTDPKELKFLHAEAEKEKLGEVAEWKNACDDPTSHPSTTQR